MKTALKWDWINNSGASDSANADYDVDLFGGSDFTYDARIGEVVTRSIVAPLGWTVSWQVLETENETLFASGTGRTLTFLPTTFTDANARVISYDFVVIAVSPGAVTTLNRAKKAHFHMAPRLDENIPLHKADFDVSTTSINLATVSFPTTINIGTGKSWGASEVALVGISNPVTPEKCIIATTSGYDTATGVLSLSAGTKNGTGTIASWNVGRRAILLDLDVYVPVTPNYRMDFGSIDLKSIRILVCGTKTNTSNSTPVDSDKPIVFINTLSTDEDLPVHVLAEPGLQMWIESRNTSIISSLEVQANCRNVYFDGAGDRSILYGFKLGYAETQTLQAEHVMHLITSSSSTDQTTAQLNLNFIGFDIDGYSRASSGLISRGDNTGDNEYAAWATGSYAWFSGYRMTNFRVRNCYNELVYMNQTAAGVAGSAYAGISYSRMWNFICDHAGNESWQMAITVNCQVFDIYSTDGAYRNNGGGQNNLVQLVDNLNLDMFNCYFQGDGGQQVFQLLTGTKGNNVNLWNWVLSNRNANVTSCCFLRFDDHDTLTEVNIRMDRFLLDVPNTTAEPMFNQKSSGGAEGNKLVQKNWTIVTADSLVVYDTSGTPSTTNWWGHLLRDASDLESYIVRNTETNNPGFWHYTNKNFRPATLTAALYAAINENEDYASSWYARDIDGVQWFDDIRGPHSGWELKVGAPASAIQSGEANTDIVAVEGTVFGDVDLPAQAYFLLADGKRRPVDVSWAQGSYDKDVIGTYAITGTPSNLPADVSNPSNVTTTVDVEVIAAPAATNYTIALGSTTNEAGMYKTGTAAPFLATDTDEVMVITDSAGATDPNIQLRFKNTSDIIRWLQRTVQTLTFAGGGGSPAAPALPASMCTGVMVADKTAANVPRIGKMWIEEKSGGSAVLTNRTFTLWVFVSRAGTGVRNCDITCNGSAPTTIDALGNTTLAVRFTGVQLVGGHIEITTTYNPTGSDGTVASYITAIKFDSV